MSKNENTGYLTMTISPEMQKIMKDTFNLEIEMMQGKCRKLKNGWMKYKIEIHDPQKNEMVKEFLLKMFTHEAHKPEAKN